MKHKHSEVIKAFVDGIECEYLGERTNQWYLITDLSTFDIYIDVRIKPEPQKEEDPQYLYVYNHTTEDKTLMLPTIMYVSNGMWTYMGKVRIEK